MSGSPFAKPKVDEDSDVDSDMLNHIALRRAEGLCALLVASADGQAFRLPLEDIARTGTPVSVLGFREHASWALASDTLEFVDLEDIPGVFREPLPRIGLDSLPEQGRGCSHSGRFPRCCTQGCEAGTGLDSSYFGFGIALESPVFAWWGRTVYRYRYIVIGIMVALCIGGGIFGIDLGKHVTQSGFHDEGSQSVTASLLADGAYGRDTSGHIVAIYTAPDGKTVDDPAFSKKILDNLDQAQKDHP